MSRTCGCDWLWLIASSLPWPGRRSTHLQSTNYCRVRYKTLSHRVAAQALGKAGG